MESKFAYRVLYKVYSTEKQALGDMKKLPSVVSNPKVVYNVNTDSYLLVLYECNTRSRAEDAMQYYKKNGCWCCLQVVK